LLSARLTTERILKEIGVTRPSVTPLTHLNWVEP
jgi:hypothetical protein